MLTNHELWLITHYESWCCFEQELVCKLCSNTPPKKNGFHRIPSGAHPFHSVGMLTSASTIAVPHSLCLPGIATVFPLGGLPLAGTATKCATEKLMQVCKTLLKGSPSWGPHPSLKETTSPGPGLGRDSWPVGACFEIFKFLFKVWANWGRPTRLSCWDCCSKISLNCWDGIVRRSHKIDG